MDLDLRAGLLGFLAFFVTAWMLPADNNWRMLIAIGAGGLAYILFKSDEE